MTYTPALDDRLASAFAFVRPGAVVADIGTDHAYLPAALIHAGIASRAVAADIHAGPLVHAAETVARYGLADRITLRQTDGLHGIEDFGATDILIFGMGGELIARILDEAPFTRDPSLRLILQPMTRQAELRRWLTGHGYAIVGERMSSAAGKRYQTICAVYGGENSALSPLEAEFGPCILRDDPPLLRELMAHRIRVLEARLAGRHAGGLDDGEDGEMLALLRAWMDEHVTPA